MEKIKIDKKDKKDTFLDSVPLRKETNTKTLSISSKLSIGEDKEGNPRRWNGWLGAAWNQESCKGFKGFKGTSLSFPYIESELKGVEKVESVAIEEITEVIGIKKLSRVSRVSRALYSVLYIRNLS